MSISLCCNVYNDAHALRGLLESGARFFDNIFILHTGPGGAHSTDGTIELVEKFGATLRYDDIERGFGAVRTRLIHECGCDWAFILDADERFFPQINVIRCEGTDRYPNPPEPKLTVRHEKEVIDQGGQLKDWIQEPSLMAIRTTRRHWFDFGMRRPGENWELIWDHQLRIVRNVSDIEFSLKMHEQLWDNRTGKTPKFRCQDPIGGPFHDHFHLAFRLAYPGSKEWNEQQYARLNRGEKMLIR